MSAPTRCLRHRTRWLAYCDDCTAWHLAHAKATRDAAARSTAGSTATILTLVPATARPIPARRAA